MDTSRFDRITMVLVEAPSRRDLLRVLGLTALGAGSLSLLGSADEAEAKKRRKKKRKKKKNRDKCKGRCGGSCPRCGVGTSCDDRDECTTAFCDGGVCTEPNDALQCGLDTDGVTNCARRDNAENGESYCSRLNCNFFATGGCEQCSSEEICSPAGDDIECCLPCGSPL